MSSFVLKVIAIITMFCDHFGDAFIGHTSFLNLIGRIAFPIFAFQITEGYIHTKSLKKYMTRLGIFAIISQIPFILFIRKFINPTSISLNVFFTLFLGLLSIFLYDYIVKLFEKNTNINIIIKKNFSKYIDKIIGVILVLLIAYIAEILNTDYGFWGVIIIFIFFVLKKHKILLTISYIILCILKYAVQIIGSGYNLIYIGMMLFTMIPIIFIISYNGKQGKKIKYFLYLFYPLHLILLYFIF